jgi:hypothetical protein
MSDESVEPHGFPVGPADPPERHSMSSPGHPARPARLVLVQVRLTGEPVAVDRAEAIITGALPVTGRLDLPGQPGERVVQLSAGIAIPAGSPAGE